MPAVRRCHDGQFQLEPAHSDDDGELVVGQLDVPGATLCADSARPGQQGRLPFEAARRESRVVDAEPDGGRREALARPEVGLLVQHELLLQSGDERDGRPADTSALFLQRQFDRAGQKGRVGAGGGEGRRDAVERQQLAGVGHSARDRADPEPAAPVGGARVPPTAAVPRAPARPAAIDARRAGHWPADAHVDGHVLAAAVRLHRQSRGPAGVEGAPRLR